MPVSPFFALGSGGKYPHVTQFWQELPQVKDSKKPHVNPEFQLEEQDVCSILELLHSGLTLLLH